MSTSMVNRFDVAALGKPQRTSQGFLRIPAFLTRTGVLEYKRADGTTVRELRPAEEVFAPTSLATLSAAPVTDLHPTQMISPANVRQLAIGHVSEDVRPDGELVAASVTVQHADAIEAVERGERRELSCGYQCRIDATPGVHNGQPYDQVQRAIVYNHVALGPRNWGRAGRDVALRLDAEQAEEDELVFRLEAADAISVADVEPPLADDADEPDEDDDEGDAEADDAGDDDDPDPEPAESAAAAERFDAVVAERDALRAALAAEQDPSSFNAKVHARATLLLQARNVLPDDFRFDGMSDRKIHEAVLAALNHEAKLATEDDDYVRGRFDAAMAAVAPRNRALEHVRRALTPMPPSSAQTRADAKPYVPEWMRPLTTTRDRTGGTR